MCILAHVGQGSTLGIILQVLSTWFYEPGTGLGSPSIVHACRPADPRNLPVSTSPALGLQAWTTMLVYVHVPSQSVKKDPQQELSQGLKQCWGSQSLNWRKTDFILLNKKERRGEEEREKKCLNMSVTEPTEEICKIGKRNSIFPGRFLINTNETWVIFPIKMNVFSKHVHW